MLLCGRSSVSAFEGHELAMCHFLAQFACSLGV